ncbi:MAG: hypothetical protein IH608_10020 [Proteobacteria bacterium]|nr:hypothetical protein [Pseudomonadota bacterium]
MSRTSMMFAVVMALALGMMACEKKTSEKESDVSKSAGRITSDAAKATGNAVGDAAKATGNAVGDAAKGTGDYLTQSKDSAVKAAQETLSGLEGKWQDLEAKAAPTTDAAKADLQRAKEQMVEALSDAKTKLAEAKDASDSAWEQNIKPALVAALAKAQKLYEDTAAKFSVK